MLSEDVINSCQIAVVFFCLQLIHFIRDGSPLRVNVSDTLSSCSVGITDYVFRGVGYEEVSDGTNMNMIFGARSTNQVCVRACLYTSPTSRYGSIRVVVLTWLLRVTLCGSGEVFDDLNTHDMAAAAEVVESE